MAKIPINRDEINHQFLAAIHSPTGERLALRTAKRRGNAWREGACLVLAEAVLDWLGEENVALWHLSEGFHEHIFVRIDDLAIDGNGIAPVETLLDTWITAGGVQRDRVVLEPISMSEAEHLGIEFDDWATAKLANMFARMSPRASALLALRE